MKTKLLLILSFFNLLSFAQGVNNIEWEPIASYTTEESWNTFLETKKTTNSKPDLSAFTFDDKHTIIYDNENNAYDYYLENNTLFLKKYNPLTNTWIDLNYNDFNEKGPNEDINESGYLGSSLIRDILIDSNGYIFITYVGCSECLSENKTYILISSKTSSFNTNSFQWNTPTNIGINDSIWFTRELQDIHLIDDYFYFRDKDFQVFKSTKKKSSNKLILHEKIEWEPVVTYTTEESWDTFLEANKTTNSKPDLSAFTFSNQHTIIYDNENNAYNYYESDGSIFLEKYNSLTNTSIDLNFNNFNEKIFDGIQPNYYGSSFIKEIIINNDGYLFITYEGCPLCFGLPVYGLISSKNNVLDSTSFEWNNPISSFLNDEIIFTYEDNIYLINDYLYVEKKDFVNKNNENVAFQIFKSTKKTLSNKLIPQEKTANIKFIDHQFVGSNNENIKIYNTIGQTIPNKNLSKNTIYILTITNTNGNTSSFKMIAQ